MNNNNFVHELLKCNNKKGVELYAGSRHMNIAHNAITNLSLSERVQPGQFYRVSERRQHNFIQQIYFR